MLYAILCYNDEDTVFSWSKEEEQVTMDRLIAVQAPLGEAGKLGPVARLMPTTAATTLRKGKNEPLVVDGPFAETKEQFGGYHLLDCRDLEEALALAERIPTLPHGGVVEVRAVEPAT